MRPQGRSTMGLWMRRRGENYPKPLGKLGRWGHIPSGPGIQTAVCTPRPDAAGNAPQHYEEGRDASRDPAFETFYGLHRGIVIPDLIREPDIAGMIPLHNLFQITLFAIHFLAQHRIPCRLEWPFAC